MKRKITTLGKAVEKTELSYIANENRKWRRCYRKQFPKSKQNYHSIPSIL